MLLYYSIVFYIMICYIMLYYVILLFIRYIFMYTHTRYLFLLKAFICCIIIAYRVPFPVHTYKVPFPAQGAYCADQHATAP